MPPEIEQSLGLMQKQQQQQQKMMMKSRGKVVPSFSRKTIVPIIPSKLAIHPVSKLDSILGNFYLHTVIYLDGQQQQQQQQASSWEDEMEDFNLSLAKALDLFPAMSGRLRVVENGNLGIKSNDAGVRLTEATCDSSLADWLDEDGDASHLFPEVRITDYSTSPLCTIQYTKFRCGSVALGVSWCHVLADFMSMDLFLKAWGEAHRNSGQISFTPSFSVEKPADPHLLPEPFDAQDSTDMNFKASDLEARVFHFSSKSVEKLMQESAASEIDAVCALVWKSMVESQGESAPETSRLCLWMNPGSDKHRTYFGNAATAFKFVDAASTDLLTQSTQEVAKRIQLGAKMNGSNKGASSFFAKNVLFCNWAANVPCYDTDFGFSRPVYVESCATSLFGEGMVTISPGSEGGRSKSVCLSIGPEAMKRLMTQDSWFASDTTTAVQKKSSTTTTTTITGAPAA